METPSNSRKRHLGWGGVGWGNRSLLSNVIDVDFEAMRVSLKHERGMLILFDFEAAFPSLSREFMLETLQGIGFPPNLLQVISCLYHNNAHLLRLKGQLFPSFCASSGVRQGCPLSPLLFIICVVLLLRRLKSWFPESTVRAYADDNAMITDNFIHREFAQISNLRLNLPKTVLIPLWPHQPEQLKKTLLRDDMPEWCAAEVASWSRYLGFAVGLGRGTHSWDKALPKFRSRVGMWSSQKLGMHYTAKVYNTFAFSSLGNTKRHPILGKDN